MIAIKATSDYRSNCRCSIKTAFENYKYLSDNSNYSGFTEVKKFYERYSSTTIILEMVNKQKKYQIISTINAKLILMASKRQRG